MRSFVEYLSEATKNNSGKIKIVAIQGSPRTKKSCSGGDSKTSFLMDKALDELGSDVKVEALDLCVIDDQPQVRPCKGCISTANGFQCHYPCIEETQRVHLLDGFKQIKDVLVGDILQDGNKVTKHILTGKNEKIYELKLNDGRCLKLTDNHRLKTLSKKRFRDYASNFSFYRKEEWKELKDLSVGDYIPSIEISDDFSKQKTKEDYLYTIYGMIWGDGTLCNDSAILYVDAREKEFIENIKQKFKSDIISILPHQTPNSMIRKNQKNKTQMLKINFGTNIGKKFKNIFIKSKAIDRRLNIKAFKNKNQVLNFLNGWVSTDGSIHKSKYICINNTSFDLLRDTQLLLSRIYVKSNITDLRHLHTEIRGKKYQRCSYITVSDQDSVAILQRSIDFINPKKNDAIKKIKVKRKLKHHFSKIKSIQHVGYGDVYDIEVENSHCFNCEGINVHNCSCYGKDDGTNDFMHENDVYEKMQKADGFVVFTPVNWYAPSSQVKAFFDRLVCINLTLDVKEAKKIMGGDIKNPKLTTAAELSGKYKDLLKNHYEGKVGAFFIHGDDGADDYKGRKLPLSMVESKHEKYLSPYDAIMPIVHQCRYSGIFVPENCIEGVVFGYGKPYSQNNKDVKTKEDLIDKAIGLVKNLVGEIRKRKE
jgi:intein/homing endonuclease